MFDSKVRSVAFFVLIAFALCAGVAAQEDVLLYSRMEQLVLAINNGDIPLVFTFFHPRHLLENLYYSDLDLSIVDDKLMDRALCEWGFMAYSGRPLCTLREIEEVRAFRFEPAWDETLELILTVRLADGTLHEYSAFVDADSWLLFGAAG